MIQCTFLYFSSVTKLYDNLEVKANLTWITSSDIKGESELHIKTSFPMEMVKEKCKDSLVKKGNVSIR